MLAVAGGPHSRFATETTGWIATAMTTGVSVIHVNSPNANQTDRTEANHFLGTADEMLAGVSEVFIIPEANNVGEQILNMAAADDITVFGAPTAGLLRRAVFENVSDRIADIRECLLLVENKTAMTNGCNN